MESESVQTNPFHASLNASYEAYLGRMLGEMLETDAKLRLANQHIQHLQEKITEYEAIKEQFLDAQKTLKAVISNKDAFEAENNHLRNELKELRKEMNTSKRKPRKKPAKRLDVKQTETGLGDGKHSNQQE